MIPLLIDTGYSGFNSGSDYPVFQIMRHSKAKNRHL